MKKQIALVWFLIVLMLPLIASELMQSNPDYENAYGLESGRTYSSDEVASFLDIATEESDAAIDQAFADGYKAGLLESEPQEEYWKNLSKSIKSDLDKEQKAIKIPWWSIPVGTAFGFSAGLITAVLHMR